MKNRTLWSIIHFLIFLLCTVQALAQGTVTSSQQATCSNGNGVNLLFASSSTTYNGTVWNGHSIGSQIYPEDYPFDSCGSGSMSGSYCVNIHATDATYVNVIALGRTEGSLLGYFYFDAYHQLDGVNQGQVIPAVTSAYCPPITGSCTVNTNPHCGASPIIIPLHSTNQGNQVQLTDPAAGVDFDIYGTGQKVRVSWIADDSAAFLAVDRNGNGVIDSGKELFGDSTDQNANGFLALDDYMGHGAKIDPSNPKWNTLLLWTDINHNGISEPGELQPVGNVLKRISTGAVFTGKKDPFGNLYEWQGRAWYLDKPDPRPIFDIGFNVGQ